MRRACVLALISVAACAPGETPAMRATLPRAEPPDAGALAPTPVDAPAVLPAEPSPPAATGATPLPEPGPGLVASPLAPGHYATDVRYHQESACSQSWDSYSAHGSLLLDVAPDGSATACRGKHMHDAGPGYGMEMMEQQGFVGVWRPDGEWLDVTLALADTPACPQLRGYTNLAPEPWHLRCVALAPAPGAASPPVAMQVAGCQFVDRVYTEELGYVVQSLLDGEWVLLAAGPGLRVVSDEPMPWDRVHYEVGPAPAPIGVDAWRAP